MKKLTSVLSFSLAILFIASSYSCQNDDIALVGDADIPQAKASYNLNGGMTQEDFDELGDFGLLYSTVEDGNIGIRYEYNKYRHQLNINPNFTFTQGSTGNYYLGDIQLEPIGGTHTGYYISEQDGLLTPGNSTYEKLKALAGTEVVIKNILDNGEVNFEVPFMFPPLIEPFEAETLEPPHGVGSNLLKRDAIVTLGEGDNPERDVMVVVSYNNSGSGEPLEVIIVGMLYEGVTNKLQLNPDMLNEIPSEGRIQLEVLTANAEVVEGTNQHSYFFAISSRATYPALKLE